jgi:hypothetical protein
LGAVFFNQGKFKQGLSTKLNPLTKLSVLEGINPASLKWDLGNGSQYPSWIPWHQKYQILWNKSNERFIKPLYKK